MTSKKKAPSPQPSNGKRKSTEGDVEVGGENGVAGRELSIHGDDDDNDNDVSSEILRVETEADKPLSAFARVSKTFRVRFPVDVKWRVPHPLSRIGRGVIYDETFAV